MINCPHMHGAALEITADNFADDLVAGNYSRHSGREFAFDDMEIGAAHSACQDFQQDMTGLRFWRRNLFDFERRLRNRRRSRQDCGLHE
jgi:hypothetical protein